MSSFRIRPKFEYSTHQQPDDVIQSVKKKLANNPYHLTGVAMQDHITLRVLKSHQHFWSPQLSILLQKDENDDKTNIIGVYGPMPNVWTLFTLSYLAIGVLTIFIGITGYAQKALGEPAPLLWAIPILLGIALIMYISSQMGQKLAAAQMYAMHYFFQDVLAEDLPDI